MAEKKLSVAVYSQAGEKLSSVNLSSEVFGVKENEQVMHDAVLVYQANMRQDTAKTKKRDEVSGGGKKPWRQKGTGRARAGSSRSPIWVGGGTVFGPDGNQDYTLNQNRKEHRLALKSALSLKVKEGLVVVDNIAFTDKKTKDCVKFLTAVKACTKVLMVVKEIDANAFASVRNLGWVKLVTCDNVSVLDLLNSDYLVISQEAIKEVEGGLK